MSAGGSVWEDGQYQLSHLGVAVRADSMWGARGLLGLWQILCGLPEIRVGFCYSSDVMSMRLPAHKLEQVVGTSGFPLSGSHRDDAAVAAMPIFSWLDPCFGHSGDVAWPMSTQRPPCSVAQPFRMCLGWASQWLEWVVRDHRWAMQPNIFDLAQLGTSVDKLIGISFQRSKSGSCGPTAWWITNQP